MTASGFEIQITAQGWFGTEPELDWAHRDLCSHGDVRLTIGGQQIAAGDGAGEYGISEGALALLRTLYANHSSENPVAQRLIPHGCGTILMQTCPIGIDWSVTHSEELVRITDVVRYDTVDETHPARFPGLAVEVSRQDYGEQVLAFAQAAKTPFAAMEKVFSDHFDRQMYAEFWDEYDDLLARAAG
jgi:hypothetical protein